MREAYAALQLRCVWCNKKLAAIIFICTKPSSFDQSQMFRFNYKTMKTIALKMAEVSIKPTDEEYLL